MPAGYGHIRYTADSGMRSQHALRLATAGCGLSAAASKILIGIGRLSAESPMSTIALPFVVGAICGLAAIDFARLKPGSAGHFLYVFGVLAVWDLFAFFLAPSPRFLMSTIALILAASTLYLDRQISLKSRPPYNKPLQTDKSSRA
jgi:hypothetical protein